MATHARRGTAARRGRDDAAGASIPRAGSRRRRGGCSEGGVAATPRVPRGHSEGAAARVETTSKYSRATSRVIQATWSFAATGRRQLPTTPAAKAMPRGAREWKIASSGGGGPASTRPRPGRAARPPPPWRPQALSTRPFLIIFAALDYSKTRSARGSGPKNQRSGRSRTT